MVSLEHYYLTGIPIPIKDLGLIHQPTIRQLLENGYSIEEFVYPFLIRVESIDISSIGLGELEGYINDFDLLFLKTPTDEYLFKDAQGSLLSRLVECLKLLYNSQNVKLVYEEQTIYINKELEINRNNFTKLADIVLEIFQTPKQKKPDNKPKYKDKYRQQLWEKLERRRAEEAKKKALSLADIINIVVHIEGFKKYSDVSDMTYYQLLNTYQTSLGIISYNEYLMFKSSGQFDMKQDTKHWTTNTKVSKSTIIA